MDTPSQYEIESQIGESLPPDTEIEIINSLPDPAGQQSSGFVLLYHSAIDYIGKRWQVFLQTKLGHVVKVYLIALSVGAPVPSPYEIVTISASKFASFSYQMATFMANDTTYADAYLAALPSTGTPLTFGNQTELGNLPIGSGVYPVSRDFLQTIDPYS